MESLSRLTVVIGAMKAGTTSLFNYLGAHPEVCPSTIKELSYFSDDERFARGEAWYRSMFEWNPDLHTTGLDASPRYSKAHSHPHSVERFQAFPAELRFVYLVRDPISRIESHRAHARARGWTIGDQSWSKGVHPEYLAVSRYASQARRYRDAFGADRLKVVRFEDLADDTEATVQQICAFAGIAPHPNPKATGVAHNTKEDRIATGTVVRRLRRSTLVRTAVKVVPKPLRDAVIRGTAEDPDKFRLPPPQREEVRAALAEELTALRDEFGIDISGWETAPR